MPKKIFIIIIYFLSLASKIQAETIVKNLIIEGNITWEKDKSPYLIKDDIQIKNNSSLTIEPGVKIIVSFRRDKPIKILVNGNLSVKGKENDPVIFTSEIDKEKSWQGIIFEGPDSGTSVIEYSNIENARCAIACFKSSPGIQNNILSVNEIAIVCEDHSSPEIAGNKIINNGIAEIYPSAIFCGLWSSPSIKKNFLEKNYGHSIYCDVYSSPEISENTINTMLGADIVCASFSNPRIINNDLTKGTSEFSIILYNSSPEIAKNKIYNKRFYGITSISSSPIIYSNIISENSVGIFFINSSGFITDNTVSHSKTGFILAENSRPEITRNNIFSNQLNMKLIRNGFEIDLKENSRDEKNKTGEFDITDWKKKHSGNDAGFSIGGQVSGKITPGGKAIPVILFRSFLEGAWNIGLLDGATSQWKLLTKNNSHSGSAVWSTGNNSIIFTSNREGNWDIFTMDLEGKNVKNITNSPFFVEEAPPIFSPDGKKLCFQRETPECQTVIMDMDSKHIEKLDINKIEENYPGLYPLVFTWMP